MLEGGRTAVGTEAIATYLKRWKDPRRIPLEAALAEAEQNPEGLRKARLAFSETKGVLPISPNLLENREVIRFILGQSADVKLREMELGAERTPGFLLFMDNMVKREHLTAMLDALVVELRHEPFPTSPPDLLQFLQARSLVSAEIGTLHTLGDMVTASLSGDTVLLVSGLRAAVRLGTRGWEHRQPEEPQAEPVVRGPKEGFTETIGVNLALIRRRLQDDRLRVESFHIGERTRTAVQLVYLDGIILPELVLEVRVRLGRIKIDGGLESGVVEELIQDDPFTPFPLMKPTERPDVVAAGLLQGRFAVLVDGTPHALIAPTTFAGQMQSAEDYYQHWLMGSFIRMLRYLYLMVALLGPAVYVAVTTFHHEMLPTNLLLSLMSAREGVPFPAVLEAIAMELTFEALREAGVRLPKPVGQAISIVGALVIGEAAVMAGLVSPVMVIVVSITAISNFIIPTFSTTLAIRLLRFPMTLLAATLGFYGVALGLLVMSVHLASLRSFGVPYMSPTMPPTYADMKDMFIRVPWWAMRKRPKHLPVLDRLRQQPPEAAKPTPEQPRGVN